MFLCSVSVFSQNKQTETCAYAYLPIKDNNSGKIQKYRGFGNEYISKSILLKAPELLVEDFGAGYVIKSFQVATKIGLYYTEYAALGNQFSDQMRNDIFMKVTRGSKIYIENIKVEGKDGVERMLPVMLVIVVE